MKRKLLTLLGLVGLPALLQLARFGLKELFFAFTSRSLFADRCASLVAMVLLSALLVLACRLRGVSLHVFPQRFGWPYWVGTGLYLALLISTPLITGETAPAKLVLLVYSGVIVPIFEELIFRGLVWEKLKAAFEKDWLVYVLCAVLFALWHLGYVDSLALRVQSGLGKAMFWKAMTGLGFGVVLGLLRWKAKNCYATMLLHGAMNIFGR